jgi:hypothetical protein
MRRSSLGEYRLYVIPGIHCFSHYDIVVVGFHIGLEGDFGFHMNLEGHFGFHIGLEGDFDSRMDLKEDSGLRC